ncbi:MAG: YlxR family protein [Oscillospiraceae bacterium]|nr:YlxR family protein [Oscillospiraceae bacterium]
MPKKIPLRQCVGCREMKPKKELIRVVRSPEGEVSLDFKGKKPGRGAYVCPNDGCLTKAKKARALERAFGAALPPDVYGALAQEMEAGCDTQ